MDIQHLKQKFFIKRNYESENVNELMDFAKNAYIHNEISIKEYRYLVGDLEASGASIPETRLEEEQN